MKNEKGTIVLAGNTGRTDSNNTDYDRSDNSGCTRSSATGHVFRPKLTTRTALYNLLHGP